MSRSAIQAFVGAFAIALIAGCAASKYGAHISKIKDQVVSTSTPAGEEWVRLASEKDPEGIAKYLETRGAPDYILVHDYYRVDLFYLGRNEMVRCTSSLGIVATACLPEGEIPQDVRSQLATEPLASPSPTPAPPEEQVESPTPTATADLATPPAPIVEAPTPPFFFRKVPIGGAIRESLAECTSEGFAPPPKEHPCFLGATADSATIYFDDNLNPILRRKMLAVLIDGYIRALQTTFDKDDARELAELLRAKYGPPHRAVEARGQDLVDLVDLVDTQGEVTEMTWSPTGGITIEFAAPTENGAKTGDLVVKTELPAEQVDDASNQERQRLLQERQRLLQERQRLLDDL